MFTIGEWTIAAEILFQSILYICGALAVILNGVKVIGLIIKKGKQPIEDMKNTIADKHDDLRKFDQEFATIVKAHEDHLKEHDRMLDNDKKTIDALNNDMKIMLRTQLSMLDHMINGNSQEMMVKTRNELSDHLISR